jgi:hypothetical protein
MQAPVPSLSTQTIEFTSAVVSSLLAVREELYDFSYQTLIENRAPEAIRARPIVLPLAFDDEGWRHSPLFRKYRTGPAAWVLDAVDWIVDLNAEKDLHAAREAIGQEWSLLFTTALLADAHLMRLFTLGAQSHLMRTVPLRLHPAVSYAHRPRDLGRVGAPLRWQLGPLSIFYAYGAFLAYALGNETLIRRIALPEAVASPARELEDMLVERIRRHLRSAVVGVTDLIRRYEQHLQPGDLVVADGFLAALLQHSLVTWEDVAPLVSVSPITRILRVRSLLALAGRRAESSLAGYTMGMPSWPGLLCLAETDQLPGLHQRLSQYMADACYVDALDSTISETVFDETASAVYWIADHVQERLNRSQAPPTEADYWSGVLLWRMYRLAHRDLSKNSQGGLSGLRARRGGTNYLWGMAPSGMLYLLFTREGPDDLDAKKNLLEDDGGSEFERLCNVCH